MEYNEVKSDSCLSCDTERRSQNNLFKINLYINPQKYKAEFYLLIVMWKSTDDYSLIFLVLLFWATWCNCISPLPFEVKHHHLTGFGQWYVSRNVTIRNLFPQHGDWHVSSGRNSINLNKDCIESSPGLSIHTILGQLFFFFPP